MSAMSGTVRSTSPGRPESLMQLVQDTGDTPACATLRPMSSRLKQPGLPSLGRRLAESSSSPQLCTSGCLRGSSCRRGATTASLTSSRTSCPLAWLTSPSESSPPSCQGCEVSVRARLWLPFLRHGSGPLRRRSWYEGVSDALCPDGWDNCEIDSFATNVSNGLAAIVAAVATAACVAGIVAVGARRGSST